MAVLNTEPMKRRPTHPGEMLREDFLPDYDLTISGLAAAVGVSRQSINEVLRGRRPLSLRWCSASDVCSGIHRSSG